MSKLIYLATPYNHPDPSIRQVRFEAACTAAVSLMWQGVHLFCPIAHTHPIAERGDLPKGWDYWKEYDHVMLNACHELWVVKIEGWDKSEGIKAEIEIAESFGMPVKYLPFTENMIIP